MTDIIVKKAVKEKCKALGMNGAADLVQGLNQQVNQMLDKAAERVKAYKKKTIKASDL
jgi:hypothetical protein